eukprot:TRINITY_DN7233_c0_g1_i1.p1 TRINITY_DN7233_c0_g1~~TRINITY_DN7233_c0_g1_i1.p1  ORF type:complete len:357 (+),score=94.52 TRINITY_DN7233_c0_g1_i1:213-1283(+)
MIDVPLNAEIAANIFEELEANEWTGRETRVVFVSYYLYARNYDLFYQVLAILEQSAAGNVRPMVTYRPFPLTFDPVIFVCDVVILLYTVWYTYKFGYGLWWAHKWMGSALRFYLFDFWNLLDLVTGLANYAMFGLKMAIYLDSSAKDFKIDQVFYPELDQLATLFNLLTDIYSFVMFLALIKLIKFLNLSERVQVLSNTFLAAMWDVIFFLVMFFVVYFAFALMGMLMFGTVMIEFSSLFFSVETNSRMMLGEFFFDGTWDVNRISAVIYFFLYAFIVILFLLNVFIGIVCIHYCEQKGLCQISFEDEVHAMMHLMMKRLTKAPRFEGTIGHMPPSYWREHGEYTREVPSSELETR